jgi:gliding motility-associated-like protein
VTILSGNISATDVNCFGGNDAGALANITIGSGPFTYSWNTSPPQVSARATGLSARWYQVIVSRSDACPYVDSILIHQPAPLSHTDTATLSNCRGATGTFHVHMSGGTAPYTFLYSVPGHSDSIETGFAPGTYLLRVLDAHGCTDSIPFIIGNLGGGTANISSHVNVTCFRQSDGSIGITTVGGAAPFTFNWSPAVSSSSTASGLTAGYYAITITDSNGCRLFLLDTITQPALLQIPNTIVAPSCGISNGSITFNTLGGTSPYTYAWTPAVSTTNSASSLAGGTYIVSVQDAHGCHASDTILLASSNAIHILESHTQDTCHMNRGHAQLNISGGSTPYNILWMPGSLTTDTAFHLEGGVNYHVLVSDPNHCADSVDIFIADFGSIDLNIGNDTIICDGGPIHLDAGAYDSYHWQDGSSKSTYTITSPGIYAVTVTNNIGCVATDSLLVVENCIDELLVPTAFSPNGDGINDLFGALAIAPIAQYHLRIYNRWGEEVYSSDMLKDKWDGTYKLRDQPMGVYVYAISYTNKKGHNKSKSGNLTLLR